MLDIVQMVAIDTRLINYLWYVCQLYQLEMEARIISGKTRRNRERRHRNMEEARAMARKILEQIRNATSEEEKAELWKEYAYYSARSTRKANHL